MGATHTIYTEQRGAKGKNPYVGARIVHTVYPVASSVEAR